MKKAEIWKRAPRCVPSIKAPIMTAPTPPISPIIVAKSMPLPPSGPCFVQELLFPTVVFPHVLKLFSLPVVGQDGPVPAGGGVGFPRDAFLLNFRGQIPARLAGHASRPFQAPPGVPKSFQVQGTLDAVARQSLFRPDF